MVCWVSRGKKNIFKQSSSWYLATKPAEHQLSQAGKPEETSQDQHTRLGWFKFFFFFSTGGGLVCFSFGRFTQFFSTKRVSHTCKHAKKHAKKASTWKFSKNQAKSRWLWRKKQHSFSKRLCEVVLRSFHCKHWSNVTKCSSLNTKWAANGRWITLRTPWKRDITGPAQTSDRDARDAACVLIWRSEMSAAERMCVRCYRNVERVQAFV